MSQGKITDQELHACLAKGMKRSEIAEAYNMSLGAVWRRINVLNLYKTGATATHAKEIAEAQIDVLHTTHALHQMIFETANETRDEVEESAELRAAINQAITHIAQGMPSRSGPGRPRKDDEIDPETAERQQLLKMLTLYLDQPDPRLLLVKLSNEERGLIERWETEVRLALDVESLKMLVDTLVVIYAMVDEPVRTKITQALLTMPSGAGKAILGIDRIGDIMAVTAHDPREMRELTLPTLGGSTDGA